MRSRFVLLASITVLFCVPAIAQPVRWADADAHLTTGEFLQQYFRFELRALNSFSLVSFYPAQSQQRALVFVIQSYNDGGKSTDSPQNRQSIRELTSASVDQFRATCGLAVVKKRWKLQDPSKAIIIKHVRIKDMQEVLAVTIDGVTSFEPEDFKRAENRVLAAGGVWAW